VVICAWTTARRARARGVRVGGRFFVIGGGRTFAANNASDYAIDNATITMSDVKHSLHVYGSIIVYIARMWITLLYMLLCLLLDMLSYQSEAARV